MNTLIRNAYAYQNFNLGGLGEAFDINGQNGNEKSNQQNTQESTKSALREVVEEPVEQKNKNLQHLSIITKEKKEEEKQEEQYQNSNSNGSLSNFAKRFPGLATAINPTAEVNQKEQTYEETTAKKVEGQGEQN